ncbi:MAG: toll/interleukin-1 receptor domain-containing protein [Hyphomonadaceae bacterium]|nr:toll/interleukin-1 receptor domain-containing protein [Hyphomonadaceae bacterium]
MITCFISYRRVDGFNAVPIRDALRDRGFEVFFDLQSIDGGEQFETVVSHAIRKSDLLIAVISKHWLIDEHGYRRLNNEDDFVRQEIEMALAHKLPIVPILVNGIPIPNAHDLPETMRPIRGFNARKLRLEDLDNDIKAIVTSVDRWAEMFARAEEELKVIRFEWQRGDWVKAHNSVSDLCDKYVQEGAEEDGTLRSIPRPIKQFREKSEKLHSVSQCFSRHEFSEAVGLMCQLEPADYPANLTLALKVAELGAKATKAIETGQYGQLKPVQSEFRKIREEMADRGFEFVPGCNELEGLLSTTHAHAVHTRIQDCILAGDYATAQTLLGEHPDNERARKFADVASGWITFFSAVSKSDWGAAQSALSGLLEDDDGDQVRAWRRFLNLLKRCVGALESMAQGDFVIDPAVRWEGGASPYATLGFDASATLVEINDKSFDIQSNDAGLSRTERDAWDALRLPEKRLLADFSGYRIASTDRARALIRKLLDVKMCRDPDDVITAWLGHPLDGSAQAAMVHWIADQLAEDGAVFLALIRNYKLASEKFAEAFKAAPHDYRLLHHLGLCAASCISTEADAGSLQDDNWHLLILAWGSVFADDRFWHNWWIDRRKVYDISKSQLEAARQRIRRFWFDELISAQFETNEFEIGFAIENTAAAAVMEAGGFPYGGPEKAVLGPRASALAGVMPAALSWMKDFAQAEMPTSDWRWQALVGFSDLAPIWGLLLAKRPGEMRDALKAQAASTVSAKDRRLLGDLTVLSHGATVEAELASETGSISEVRNLWDQSMQALSSRGHRAQLAEVFRKQAMDKAISLGMAAKQADVEERVRLTSLNKAILLLDGLRSKGWDTEDTNEALAVALTDRAVHMANERYEYKVSYEDTKKARALSPNNSRVLINLFAAMVQLARSCFLDDEIASAETLLQEAKAFKEEVASVFPGHPEFQGWCDTLAEVDTMIHSDGDLPAGSGGEVTLDPVTQGMLEEGKGNLEKALEIYRKAAIGPPPDDQARARIAMCYHSWIWSLIHANKPVAEVQSLVQRAFRECPDSDILKEFKDYKL